MTFGDQSFTNRPIGTYQGVVDFSLPENIPDLDYVYWMRGARSYEAGNIAMATQSMTMSNIIAAKSSHVDDLDDNTAEKFI